MLGNISKIISESIENIKKMIDTETIIGKPIYSDKQTIIPISKVTIGLVTGAVDQTVLDENKINKSLPIAGLGGGVNITPVGFLVIDDESTRFLKAQGDNIDKWLDIVQTTVNKLTQK